MVRLELHVSGLGGDEFDLTVCETCLGAELLQHVRQRLPRKPGAVLALFGSGGKISMSQSLEEQGLEPHSLVYYVYLQRNAPGAQ